jgi:RHS repeat-associated protein
MLAAGIAKAQSITDGSTPLALSPGSPAGSYSLSDFDSVNLYNGNLGFSLPLVKIAGRGGAGYTMTARIEQKWTVDKEPRPGQPTLYTPTMNWWNDAGFVPIYSVGRLDVRQAGSKEFSILNPCGYVHNYTLTRLTFTAPDGSEYELRDQSTNGQPQQPTAANCTNGFDRGRVFVTGDGSSATFTSDADITDWAYASEDPPNIPPSGDLVMRDGTHYRIDGGLVRWIRDRNGNKVSFGYDNTNRLTSITDSLNRQVTISCGASIPAYDSLTLKGFGGATRSIKLYQSYLQDALRSDFSLQNYSQLFPELNGAYAVPNNPGVVSAIELPNGQQYHFYYNSYAELARVVLPTGGAIEYDYAAGLTDGAASGELGGNDGNKHIYRRVVERRVYPDGGSGIGYASRMNYSRPESSTSNAGYVDSDQYDSAGNLLTRSLHYFYGSARDSFKQQPTDYPGWEDGREYQTIVYAADGTTALRQVTNTFAQRASVGWWTGTSSQEPPNDPRLVETDTTLMDTNQVSKQMFGYDDSVPYNNQNDVKEYDFGNGTPGPLIRETQTTFITSTDYTNASLLSLPSQVSISDGNGFERARTSFEYDNYSAVDFHASLVTRSGISGQCNGTSQNCPNGPDFTSQSYSVRGNVTKTTRYVLDPNTNHQVLGSLSGYSEYDVAGNVVKVIDPRSAPTNVIATTFDYRDNFGAPADTVESSGSPSNTAPTELGTSSFAYAFPFAVTNPLGQTSYTKFDYYLGRPVTSEDINGIVSRGYYDDALDRPSQVVRAVNGGSDTKSQTTFAYDDPNHVITSTSDQATYGDNVLKSQVLYDAMGRTTEKRQYESTTNYIAVQTQYDSLGRVYKTANPFRPWQSEAAIWTTLAFDDLGRVKTVTTPDSAVVTTSHSGNTVTVTDQTGKVRKSVTDGLGRLVQVYEDPAGLNYLTSYSYDTLDNLTTVNQGSQTRTFVYDSLKRLLSATNPESGTVCYGTLVSGVCQLDGYDANGNLLYKTDARGVRTTYAYDALNRVYNRSYSDGTPAVTYAYDPNIANGKGRLSYVDSSVSRYTYDNYDALGRVKSATQKIYAQTSQSYTIVYGYDLVGHVTSMSYPSQHSVSYSFDNAGRLTDFTGNLGDGSPTSRNYSTGITYASAGQMTQEKFGTTTPIYNKLFYNSRGQLSEIREGITPNDTNWERGAIINHYSNSCWGMCGGSQSTTAMTDDNGNLKKQDVYIPGVSTPFTQFYTYDSLNRLQSVAEDNLNGPASWKQSYVYDRPGNRTIDQNSANTYGTGIPNPNFAVDINTNRLMVPNGYSGSMTYDAEGNLTTDTYSAAAVTRLYDAENRMTQETQANSYVAGVYNYDGNGHRVKRNIGGVETWQVYGIGGELIAEYAANASYTAPQKEYGYRNGQILIEADVPAGAGGTAPTFADDPLVPNQTQIQLVHLTQLRTAVNDLRARAGLSAASFNQDPNPTQYVTEVHHDHIMQLRQALEPALASLHLPTVPSGGYAHGQRHTGDPIYAIDFQELRTEIKAAYSCKLNWLVQDQLGTPRMIFDQSGDLTVTDQYGNYQRGMMRHDYLPFGEELGAGTGGRTTAQGYSGDSVRQKFTDKERDGETSLDYFDARYYSSMQGRFTGVDPEGAGANPDNPQTWNGYAYVINRPTTLTDPDGRSIRICDTNGKCVEVSDETAKQYTFNKEYQKKNGYFTKGDGKIYDTGGGVIGTYENLGCDACMFPTAGLEIGRQVAPIPKATALFAGVSVAAGVTGGLVLYAAQPLIVTVTTLGIETAPETVGTDLAGLSIQQLNGIIRGTQKQLLNKLFGQGMQGAERAIESGEVPAGLTRQTLMVAKEIARRAIERGIDKGGVQAVRLKIIEEALKRIK